MTRSNPVTVRFKRSVFLQGALLSGLVAGGGGWLLSAGHTGWGAGLLGPGGAMALVFLILAARPPLALVLDDEGFRVAYGGLWRRLGRIPWREVARVGSYGAEGARARSLMLALRNPEQHLFRFSPAERRKLAGQSDQWHLAILLAAQTLPAEAVLELVRQRVSQR